LSFSQVQEEEEAKSVKRKTRLPSPSDFQKSVQTACPIAVAEAMAEVIKGKNVARKNYRNLLGQSNTAS